MTNTLKILVEEWHDEAEHFNRIAIRYGASVKILASLNTSIFRQCKKDGVDISSLKLTKR